jgi:hypothetical protein
MAEINVLAAARTRLLRGNKQTVAAAILERPDNEMVVRLIEEVYTRRGKTGSALDAVELEIAERIDDGIDYPVGNQEAFQGVLWLAQADPANIPDPMPRDFALYFAIAWKRMGRFPTVVDAMKYIFANFEFIQ